MWQSRVQCSTVSGSALVMDMKEKICVMNYNNKPVIALHNSPQAITDIIDLEKVWLPSSSLGLRPQPFLGQSDFLSVYNVGSCPRVSAITNTYEGLYTQFNSVCAISRDFDPSIKNRVISSYK